MTDRLLLPAYTLWLREMTRFYRQASRVVGTLATPLVFWLFLGSGFGTSFRAANAPAGVSYLEYFYPGSLALILLFTSIFSTISIIEDRREGFLQSVLVAPVAPVAIVLGKVLGGATIAMIQGTIFLCLAPTLGIAFAPERMLFVVAVMFLIAVGLTALGFVFAWRTDSVQGFHAVMNLFLMPMWFLSGAAFPASGAPAWLRAMMACDPLTYGLAAIRRGLYPAWPASSDVPELAPALGVLAAFAAFAVFLCVRSVAPRAPRPRSVRGHALQSSLWAFFVLVLGLVVFLAVRQWLGGSEREENGLPPAPAFALVDQDGRPLAREDLRGKVWIADFIFTRCAGPCPQMTAVMAGLQRELPACVRLISITVDPAHDTPETLARYARQAGADPARWSFLTGPVDVVRTLVRSGFHLAVDDTGDPQSAVLHSEKFLLVDPRGNIRGYYDGLDEADLARLRGDARALGRVMGLPGVNAGLNSTTALLLVIGWAFIRKKKIAAHRACMIAACGTSTLFLTSYLIYHYTAGSVPFTGQGAIRPVYFTLLFSHTLLAALVVPLVLGTLYRAARGRFAEHRSLARWTLPIWLYVSVTGVLVYFMLYRWFASPSA